MAAESNVDMYSKFNSFNELHFSNTYCRRRISVRVEVQEGVVENAVPLLPRFAVPVQLGQEPTAVRIVELQCWHSHLLVASVYPEILLKSRDVLHEKGEYW